MEKTIIYFMYAYNTCAKIELEYSTKALKEPKVTVENYTDCVLKRPFGVRNNVTYSDFKKMLEDRCFPKSRFNCKQLLRDAGLDHYDALAIVKKTHGVMSDDLFWIRFSDEEPELWNEINPR